MSSYSTVLVRKESNRKEKEMNKQDKKDLEGVPKIVEDFVGRPDVWAKVAQSGPMWPK